MSSPTLRELARRDLQPMGLAEAVFAAGAGLPGQPGQVFYRKFKRRLQRRAEARFQALAAALGAGDLALDLGANVGDLTALMAANGAEVHAYEPEPETFRLLQERFADAPNVVAHHAAVSDRGGEADLIVPASFHDNPRSASKAASIAHGRYRGDSHITRKVPLLDIRRVLADLPRPPTLIKMDIEGAELDVLEAMRADGLLGADVAVFVETHERLDPEGLPRVRALQGWANRDAPGYVNLFWG